jgi:beta-N-acetylhexosaminidase
VMVAHNAFPNLDLQEKDSNGKLLPSSLSFNFITKLLREKLDFQGLVVTDDMEMGAILRNYGIGEACKLAIKAGEDMLLICASIEQITEGFRSVLEAVENGEISESRIDESLQRIFSIKSQMSSPVEFDEKKLGDLSGEIKDFKAILR